MTNIADLGDKTIRLTTADAEGNETTVEGTVGLASAVGFTFKPKGKRDQVLVEASEVIEVEVINLATRLKQRSLQPVNEGKFRDHLIDRHGYKISDIEKFTEEQAEELHDSIDHGDLGHRHRKPKAVEEAIAEAEEAIEHDDSEGDGYHEGLED